MTQEQWKNLEYKDVSVKSGMEERLFLGEFLGCGGAGAVYDLCRWKGRDWVIKVLDPDSPVAQQEAKSINAFCGRGRFAPGLMKFNSWRGTLTCENREYFCYFMRKGTTLEEAIADKEEWLQNSREVMRLIAFLVNGIASLKNMELSHRDIKAANILLCNYDTLKGEPKLIPMLSDYGTVSQETHSIGTYYYRCSSTEYDSELEKGIAYDLHCLYMTLRGIYEDIDPLFPVSIILPEMPECVERCLRIMSDSEEKAFNRLHKLTEILKKENFQDIPVSFYLDAVPKYQFEDIFPFETIMEWNGYSILRDKNALPDEIFDPLLLMKVPFGRYNKVSKALITYNKINAFVMPIARYFDKNGEEYVLLHAPDNRNKCFLKYKIGVEKNTIKLRIQDESGIPYTLDMSSAEEKDRVISNFIEILSRQKVNIEFSARDIWHVDGIWKLNLFSVDFLGSANKNAEKVCLKWEKTE